jgi:hypothetical protein
MLSVRSQCKFMLSCPVLSCIADIPEHEEKYDGIVWFCTIYLKFFFRDKTGKTGSPGNICFRVH